MILGKERKIKKLVSKINAIDSSMFSRDFIKQTEIFKSESVKPNSELELLTKAFAFCRMVSSEVLGMAHYDVQLKGGIALHLGMLAEISTGEGKTLCATLPAYFNSLLGRKVHIVTANDYLAKRDYELTKPLYDALGVKSGFIVSESTKDHRRYSYSECDIVYTTCTELGFDYLRDNMAVTPNDVVRNSHVLSEVEGADGSPMLLMQERCDFAIVDEADSILIDDAKTPLVLTGKVPADNTYIAFFTEMANSLPYECVDHNDDRSEHESASIIIDQKAMTVHLTNTGFEFLSAKLIDVGLIGKESELYLDQNLYLVDMLLNAARAKHLYENNVHYIVFDGEVKIINQGTGRIEGSRRWSGGLHQAIESKEGCDVKDDSITLGTISIQSYFKKYAKLSGMSGTILSAKDELVSTYGLPCVKIETNKALIRRDLHDVIFKTKNEKYMAIVKQIAELNSKNTPVLVGTVSVEESELISGMLSSLQIKHSVLNAKNHEYEAEIIAGAGRSGAVTISTNMAGRGTDILLGGHSSVFDDSVANGAVVREAGGLYVIGTERADSRRIDDQLIGRSGRQGDPGKSKFFCSLEDRLLVDFGLSGSISSLLSVLYVDGSDGFHGSLIDKAIAKGQRRASAIYEGMRKNVMRFESSLNIQREAFYSSRNAWIARNNSTSMMRDLVASVIDEIVSLEVNNYFETEDISSLNALVIDKLKISDVDLNTKFWLDLSCDLYKSELKKLALSVFDLWCAGKVDSGEVSNTLSTISLVSMDIAWRKHLDYLDSMKKGIDLKAYSSKDPVVEFSKEAFSLFESMINGLRLDIVHAVYITIASDPV